MKPAAARHRHSIVRSAVPVGERIVNIEQKLRAFEGYNMDDRRAVHRFTQ
jgi:hypothetical protein